MTALPQLPVGPGTPYITPGVLRSAPTGIDWTTIPNRSASNIAQAAEVANICTRATGMIEGVCNQVLRATADTEYFSGPDYRITINRSTGNVRILVSRWPILQVLGGQVSPDVFPRNWITVPPTQFDVERPPIGLFGASQAADIAEGGQAIIMGAGFMGWWNGRNGYRIQVMYVNGWPHTSLMAQASPAVSPAIQTILVDDCTGWAPSPYDPADQQFGATGLFYDGIYQEIAQCIGSSVPSGPGVLTLAAPLTFPHSPGVMFTTLPRAIMNATIDMATSIALERGASATQIQSVSGGSGGSGGSIGVKELRELATKAAQSYARVI